MFVFVLFALVSLSQGGIIPHSESGYSQDHGHATSYQHVKIENYHPVPVYLKKEHAQFLEHPVSNGHTATSLQVNHGGKHDHGYALVSGTHQQQLLGHDVGHDLGYEQQIGGHEQQIAQQEIQQEGEADLGHYDTGAADYSGHGLQAYATQDADYGHGQEADYGHGQEATGYEQEAAGYEHAIQDAQNHGHY